MAIELISPSLGFVRSGWNQYCVPRRSENGVWREALRSEMESSLRIDDANGEKSRVAPDHFVNAVRILTQLLSSHEGSNFFHLLATRLGELCQASYCVIVKFDERRPRIGSTLAFVCRDTILENTDYDVRGTPCEAVHTGEFCHYESDIQRRFPEDAMLGELDLESYMGLPLLANDGRVLGLISLLHEKCIPDAGLAESLLRIVAARVAAELQRGQIEQELRTHQIRFGNVFENASDAIYLHDSRGAVLDANRQACESLGYERHELIGMTPPIFDPDVSQEQVDQMIHSAFSKLVTLQTRHRRKDGVVFPVEVRLRSYDVDGSRYAVAIVIDLRERHAANAALQAAQQRLELVLDASQIGFWEWDSASNRITFSDQWRHQLGYSETEAIATAEAWVSRIHPEDFPAIATAYAVMPASGQDTHQVDARVRRADGSWRWIHARGRAFRDEGGAIQKFVGLHLDDTPRKRVELALAHQKAILERIAKGEGCRQVLEAIVNFVETQIADSRSSILVLHGDRLRFGAGDKLPAAYSAAIDGVQIGPNVGSCGSAAFRGQTVVVGDIANDPLWQDFREMALGFGLRSCWSVPIFTGKLSGTAESYGQVLGTFAIYGATPGKPTAEDLEIVNNAVYLAGIAIERAKTEEALQESESRLAAVIANSPGVAIQWYDAVGRVVLWNRASEEMFGVAEKDAIGKSLEELCGAPEDPLLFREACEMIRRNGQPIGPREFEFRRADGEKGIALSTQFAIPGPRGESWFACMDVDITQRKRSEEAVRESKEMLQLVLDNIPQGVVWKDRQSRYLGMNAVVCKALKLDSQTTSGLTDFDLPHLTREQAEFFIRKDREIMESNQPQYQIVEPMTVANGATIWLNTSKIPLHDAEGTVNGILVTWEDFTEKRKAQDALQRSMTLLRNTQALAKMSGWSYDCATDKFENADGTHRILPRAASDYEQEELDDLVHVDDRARVQATWQKGLLGEVIAMEHRMLVGDDLRWVAVWAEPEFDKSGKVTGLLGVAQDITDRKRLEEQLIQSQKYEGLGVLAGGIAHEFNNILTSVLGNAELGLMRIPADSPAAPVFLEIGKAARRAASLTKQMLAYSGRDQMAVETFQLESMIHDAAPVFQSMVAHKAELHFQLSPASGLGDVIQLRQVAMQLASNALESLEGKRGRIDIRTGVTTLIESDLGGSFALAPSTPGVFAFLEFLDNGCGMPADVASKIFDPFFSTKFAGRGLGLAAVLGIIKRHRGAVQVQTAPGRGTSIRVLIPQIAATGDSPAQVKSEPQISSRKRILLVEDEPTVREFLSQLLSGAGYEVTAAKDGVEGIELAKRMRNEIAIILLDLVMPRLDGWGAFDELRRIVPAAPIILMSGYDEKSEGKPRRQMMDAAGFLQKPFRPAQLFAELKLALAAPPPI